MEAGPSEVGEGDPSLIRQRSEEDIVSMVYLVPLDDADYQTSGRPRKRARAASVDSDDLDAEVAGEAPSERGLVNVRRQPLKAIGEFMDCGECGKQFSVVCATCVGRNLTDAYDPRRHTPKSTPSILNYGSTSNAPTPSVWIRSKSQRSPKRSQSRRRTVGKWCTMRRARALHPSRISASRWVYSCNVT